MTALRTSGQPSPQQPPEFLPPVRRGTASRIAAPAAGLAAAFALLLGAVAEALRGLFPVTGAARGPAPARRARARLLAAAAAVLFLSPLIAPKAEAQTEIWAAILTVGSVSGAVGYVRGRGGAVGDLGTLSDNDFEIDGVTYTVSQVYVETGNAFLFQVDTDLRAHEGDLTLHIPDKVGTGETSFALASSTHTNPRGVYYAWPNVDSAGTAITSVDLPGGHVDGDMFTVRLTTSAGVTVTVPGAPTGLSATAPDATQIELRWTAPAMTGGADITGYQIQVSTDGTSYTDLEADTGTASVKYTHAGLTAGSTRHYKVAAINSAGTGAYSAAASATTTQPPTVSSVELTSDPGLDLTYAIGDEVEATVTFSVAVNVATEPRLTLDIDVTESSPNYANYDRGSGTAALVLSYTVEEGDEDTDGIAIVANSLVAHNAPTAVTVDATTAVLTHDAVAAHSGHKVDGVRPAFVDGSASVNGATLTLSYDEALYDKDAAATGGFTVTVAGASRSVNTVAVDGTGVTLTLASAVTSGQVVTLDYTPGSTPIRDLPGNGADGFTAQSVTNNTTAAPTVTSVEITSNPGTDATYAIGDTVEATVTFSVTVSVDTGPELILDIGGTDKTADHHPPPPPPNGIRFGIVVAGFSLAFISR